MKKKWFLYLTGFFSGMSVMAIELGAQRLLAPYFSSSQIVWTIVIGTIMIAMALGNVLGGKMADKHKNPNRLFVWLFIAAIWTALIPLFGKYVIAGVALLLATFVTKNYLIWAALLSCILVFVFPLLVLGMVTPNLVKFALKSEEESGKTVGIIEALNTIGSIIGTFLPTFVTIPNIGTALTFVVFAAILLLICLIYVILNVLNNKERLPRSKSIKSYITFLVLSLVAVSSLICGYNSKKIGMAFWDNDVIYEDESMYNYLRVKETNNEVIFSTNVLFGVQSVKVKDNELTGMYYDYALASPVIANGTQRHLEVLILGLGTGTFATQCDNYFSDIHIEGVEIDQKIVDIAYKYFDLSSTVDVSVEDGRAYLDSCNKKYDVIMVDAYQDITIPFQMSSIEFFTMVSEHLNDNGNMIVNMNMYSEKPNSINEYLCGTIAEVFDSVYVARTNTSSLELFASNNYNVKDRLENNISTIEDEKLKEMMNVVLNRFKQVDKNGLVLTDDKAPVELLGISVIDELINEELDYYRNIIKGKSLKELIEMIKSGNLF